MELYKNNKLVYSGTNKNTYDFFKSEVGKDNAKLYWYNKEKNHIRNVTLPDGTNYQFVRRLK